MAGPPTADLGFEDFFRELWRPVVGTARRFLDDQGDAEDAAAEAFARAFVDWGRVGSLPHRKAWVLRVASNVAIDRARVRRRAGELADRLTGGELDDDRSEVVVLRAALVEALGHLPSRQREAIVLRHLCGLTEEQTAAAMGVTVNSVKKHSSRAMARLRSSFGTRLEEVGLAI